MAKLGIKALAPLACVQVTVGTTAKGMRPPLKRPRAAATVSAAGSATGSPAVSAAQVVEAWAAALIVRL